MLLERKRIADLNRADYNPRVELKPGDAEYEELKKSIEQFGLLIPIVWNKRTNRVVGGHQRLTVEENRGQTEVDVSVVDLDEIKEKELNVMLNKAQGAWDDAKLAELFDSLGDRAQETGFTLPEIEALQSRIEDALDEDFLNDELGDIEQTFNVTLDFPIEIKEELNGYIREHGKEGLVELLIEAARKEA
jgi:ParB-like chromosome segregation protein Spo0J